jgi:NTE family protein
MKTRLHLGAIAIGTASWLALAVVCAGAALPASAADEASGAAHGAKRPKICLVLSGGGARGAAHVGVLKVLEEYRVPIDCIAGTSMGALVGGAYATGNSVAELEKMSREITTELLFKENPPRGQLSMRQKSDDYKPFFGPELGFKNGELRGPKGLVSGVQLEAVLRHLAKAKGYYRFDDLPIPFRAVATDLVTGKAVVFKDGELANVMRASMSVPGAVAPEEYKGMMLVDGMLTSNLPVQTARAMGADIVIAVNVGTPLLKRDQLTGLLGVTGQMLSILTEQNVQASLALLKPTDILITPHLGDYSTGDFDDLAKIVPLGEAAARKVADRLAQLSLPPEEYAALRRRQTIAVAPDTRPVDEIRFDAMQRVNPKTAQAVMQTQPGKPLDQKVLDEDMRRLYGMGDFEHVSYRFLGDSGRRVLAVDATEKSWGPGYVRFGLGLSSDFQGDAFFDILASYRRTWMNSLGAEWRTDLQVGHTNSLVTEFYQPLNAEGTFFVAPHAGFTRTSADIYQGKNRVATYDADSGLAGADVGMQFEQFGTLRVGAVSGYLDPSLDTGPQSLSPGASHIAQGAFTAKLLLDQLDSVHFPRFGWRFAANTFNSNSSLGADDSYTKWDAEGNVVYSVGEHTVNLYGKAGGSTGSNPLPRYDEFQWGGFLQLTGLRTGQLYGQDLRYGRAMYYHRILEGTLLEGAYGGVSLEAGKVGDPLVPGNDADWIEGYGLFAAADTPLGPAYLGYGHASGGNNNVYFYLGRPF